MDPELRRRLVDRYRGGHAEVVSSLDAITAEELDRCHPGEWSAREVVHHLADSETTSYVRLRKLIAEDWLEIYAAHAHDHADQIRRARIRER